MLAILDFMEWETDDFGLVQLFLMLVFDCAFCCAVQLVVLRSCMVFPSNLGNRWRHTFFFLAEVPIFSSYTEDLRGKNDDLGATACLCGGEKHDCGCHCMISVLLQAL